MLESTKNPYDVLGIPKDSNLETAKNAYRKLSMKYHPDRNQGDPQSEEKFKEIFAAYEMIKSPGKNRRVVDQPSSSYRPTSPPRTYTRPSETEEQKAGRRAREKSDYERAERINRENAERIKRSQERAEEAERRWNGFDANQKKAEAEFKRKSAEIMDQHHETIHAMETSNLKQSMRSNWPDLRDWKQSQDKHIYYFTDPEEACTISIWVDKGTGESTFQYKV